MKSFWEDTAAVSMRIASAPKLLVTLDFDGTLATLEETPEQVRLEPQFKSALRALASLYNVSVFILSGRALKNICKLVGLLNLYYGGNHGIEIKGPAFAWRDTEAAKVSNLVARIATNMQERFPPATGVLVENKTFSASVHYRNLKAKYRQRFFSRMKILMSAQDGLIHWRRGYKVFELLPQRATHKGNALNLLSKKLGNPLGIAVGDDLTDEDMFMALAKKGITIRVGKKADSKAEYFLSGQKEVLRLLHFIISVRRR